MNISNGISKRYFLVVYTGSSVNGTVVGNVLVDGSYPNEREFSAELKKENGISNPVITNIIEMNEREYNEYIKE